MVIILNHFCERWYNNPFEDSKGVLVEGDLYWLPYFESTEDRKERMTRSTLCLQSQINTRSHSEFQVC